MGGRAEGRGVESRREGTGRRRPRRRCRVSLLLASKLACGQPARPRPPRFAPVGLCYLPAPLPAPDLALPRLCPMCRRPMPAGANPYFQLTEEEAIELTKAEEDP